MTVKFNSTPQDDMFIYAGLDPKDSAFRVDPHLIGAARLRAISNIYDAYANYKQNLKISYKDYISLVESNLDFFARADTTRKVKQAVSAKLKEMANARLQEEAGMNGVELFFHKLLQFVRLKGFQTLGNYGSQLADKIVKVNLKPLIQQIKTNLTDVIGNAIPIEGITNELNLLSKNDFDAVLNEAYFSTKEGISLQAQKPLIFEGLNEEKKALFLEALYKRKDWFEQSLNILEGAEEEFQNGFIDDQFIFNASQSDLVQITSATRSRTKQVLDQIVPKIISLLLKKNTAFSEVIRLFQKLGAGNQHFAESKLLTEDERKTLKENINFSLL